MELLVYNLLGTTMNVRKMRILLFLEILTITGCAAIEKSCIDQRDLANLYCRKHKELQYFNPNPDQAGAIMCKDGTQFYWNGEQVNWANDW